MEEFKPEFNFYPIDLDQSFSGVQTNTPALPLSSLNLVATGGGSALPGGAVSSPNFSSGLVGWRLNADGVVEAQQVRVGPAAGAEKLVLQDSGMIGYASDGTTVIFRFLNEPSDNVIMQLNKYDYSPSYGNALNIEDASTTSIESSVLIHGSGAGNVSDKTLLEVDGEFTNATDLVVFRGEGTKNTITLIWNESGTVNDVLYVKNSASGGNTLTLENTAGGGHGLSILQTATGDGIFLDKNSVGDCIEFDLDCDSASDAFGLAMNIANAGAGGEFAFRFDGSEFDATAGGNTQTERIKIKVNGNTRYIYAYSN